MKKTRLVVAVILVLVLLGGCSAGTQDIGAGLATSDAEAAASGSLDNHSLDFDDLGDDVRKQFKADIFYGMEDTFELFDVSYQVTGLAVVDSLDDLEKNDFELPPDALLADGTLNPSYRVVLVSMRMENMRSAENQMYTNSFSLISITSPDPEEWSYAQYFYSNFVENPKPANKHYARIYFKPNEKKEIVIGYLMLKSATEYQNHYVQIGTTGSTSDPSIFIKLEGLV